MLTFIIIIIIIIIILLRDGLISNVTMRVARLRFDSRQGPNLLKAQPAVYWPQTCCFFHKEWL